MAAGLEDPEVSALDFRAFAPGDLANIALQRSAVLYGLDRRPGEIVRAWARRDEAPLASAVETLGPGIARRAAASILAEYRALRPLLETLGPRSIADIGCGYALFDLFTARDFGASLTLIDVEATENRHFGFAAEGAGYASLAVARRFLMDNGIASDGIRCVNPGRDSLDAVPAPDLAISFLSCGFHYPTDTYLPLFTRTLAKGGHVILDLRQERAPEEEGKLARIGRVSTLERAGKRLRVKVSPA